MSYAPAADRLPDGRGAEGCGDGVPPRLGGRTYGDCDGTATDPLGGVVTETFAAAVPPLWWPTRAKYSAGPVPFGMTYFPAAAALP